MSGIRELSHILEQLEPRLSAREFVFCTFKNQQYGDLSHLQPVAAVQEAEGLTLVIDKDMAQSKGLDFVSGFKRISLSVHSSLDAVGLTAAVSDLLAEHGISANLIAGYFHDHIFVPARRAEEALALLTTLNPGASNES